jgi:hypothetical protein
MDEGFQAEEVSECLLLDTKAAIRLGRYLAQIGAYRRKGEEKCVPSSTSYPGTCIFYR